jgi:hypothetical protein
MSWVRQHLEAGRVVVVARVTIEGSQYAVRLAEPPAPGSIRPPEKPSPHDANHYTSRDLAFAAADVLVRHRLGGHFCTNACSGWIEDAAIR